MNPAEIMASPVWLAAGWTMLHFVWVGGVIGLLGAAGGRCLQRATASARYVFAVCCLTLLAAAPAAILLGVGRMAPVVTQRGVGLDAIGFTVGRGTHNVAASDAATSDTNEPPEEEDSAGPSATTIAATWRLSDVFRHAAVWLPWLWLVGMPITSALTATGLVGAERLRRQSRLLSADDLPLDYRRLLRWLNLPRTIPVGIHSRLTGPVLIGILRPLILLPSAALTGWTPQQLEMVLLHELAHVRRWDNLVNLLQRVVESVLFFHPAVWWMSARVRRERECCCDAIVVQHTRQAHSYAELLLSLAEPRSAFPAASAALSRGSLLIRLRHLLTLENQTMKTSTTFLGLVFGMLFAPVLLIGSYALAWEPEARVIAPRPAVDAPEERALSDVAGNLPSNNNEGGNNSAANAVDRERRRRDGIVLKQCRVSLAQKATLSFSRTGRLVEVPAEGDGAKKGQPLAKLAEDELRTAALELRAAIKQGELTKAAFDVAVKTRNQSPDSVPIAELSRLNLEAELSALEVESREQKLEVLRKQLVIEAPFDGIVTRAFKSDSETVRPGDPVFELVNPIRLRVEGYVDVKDVRNVKPGAAVEVRPRDAGNIEPGVRATFTGKVRFVDVTANPVTEEVRVWADIENRDGLLRAGSTVTMTIFKASDGK